MHLIATHDLIRVPLYQIDTSYVFGQEASFSEINQVNTQRIHSTFEALRDGAWEPAETIMRTWAQDLCAKSPQAVEPWEGLLNSIMTKGWMMCVQTGRFDLLKPMVHLAHKFLSEVYAWDEDQQHFTWMEMGKALVTFLQPGPEAYLEADAFLYTFQELPHWDELREVFMQEAIYNNNLSFMLRISQCWPVNTEQAMHYTTEMIEWLRYAFNHGLHEWTNDMVNGEGHTKSMVKMMALWHEQTSYSMNEFLHKTWEGRDFLKTWKPILPTIEHGFQHNTYPADSLDVLDLLCAVLPHIMSDYPMHLIFPQDMEVWLDQAKNPNDDASPFPPQLDYKRRHWKQLKHLPQILERQHLKEFVRPQETLKGAVGRKI